MSGSDSYIGRWAPSHAISEASRKHPDFKPIPTDDPAYIMTYQKAAAFLSDCKIVEDWGCSFGSYRNNFAPKGQKVIGVDGTMTPGVDILTDLRTYKPTELPDGILLRHVLEHNDDWKVILGNALKSFKEKLCIVLFTPWSDGLTKEIVRWPHLNVPDLSFNWNEFVQVLEQFPVTWTSIENLQTKTSYNVEHVFYIEHR